MSEEDTAGLQLDQIGPGMARGESLWPDGAIDPFGLRDPKRSKPLVVAVQGITYTIGIELMLAADVVVAALAEFRAVQARLASSADAQEGVASFVDKRDARFAGR